MGTESYEQLRYCCTLKEHVLSISLGLYTLIDSDSCEDSHHVNELSIIINKDLTRLDKIQFQMQLRELCYFLEEVTHAVAGVDMLPQAL